MAKNFWWHTYPNPIPDGVETLTFHGDEGGGCLVECGYCSEIFNDSNFDNCPSCQSDLEYPRCDW